MDDSTKTLMSVATPIVVALIAVGGIYFKFRLDLRLEEHKYRLNKEGIPQQQTLTTSRLWFLLALILISLSMADAIYSFLTTNEPITRGSILVFIVSIASSLFALGMTVLAYFVALVFDAYSRGRKHGTQSTSNKDNPTP